MISIFHIFNQAEMHTGENTLEYLSFTSWVPQLVVSPSRSQNIGLSRSSLTKSGAQCSIQNKTVRWLGLARKILHCSKVSYNLQYWSKFVDYFWSGPWNEFLFFATLWARVRNCSEQIKCLLISISHFRNTIKNHFFCVFFLFLN